MALTIVSRESAGLPAVPASIGRRALSSWTGVKVHHTGGAFSSWKAVHDWQTAGRPVGERLAYIGYSFGVAGGRVTELRGWDRQPAHDHENSTLGVVFGGNFTGGLPAAADLAAFVEFVRLARTRIGRAVPVTGHRDTWPAGDWRYSSCPGDRLYAHLPALRRAADEEDDVAITDEDVERIRRSIFQTLMDIPGGGGEEVPFFTAVRFAAGRVLQTKVAAYATRDTMAALLAQADGLDTAAVLARIEQRSAEDAARDAAVQEALDAAAAERRAILDLVAQAGSGERDAAAVVDEIGRRLAGSDQSPA